MFHGFGNLVIGFRNVCRKLMLELYLKTMQLTLALCDKEIRSRYLEFEIKRFDLASDVRKGTSILLVHLLRRFLPQNRE